MQMNNIEDTLYSSIWKKANVLMLIMKENYIAKMQKKTTYLNLI